MMAGSLTCCKPWPMRSFSINPSVLSIASSRTSGPLASSSDLTTYAKTRSGNDRYAVFEHLFTPVQLIQL